jgi:hypothetical protein
VPVYRFDRLERDAVKTASGETLIDDVRTNDAALIAASPALYDALKALVDAVLDGDETSAHQIAKYAALAALALARGEAA